MENQIKLPYGFREPVAIDTPEVVQQTTDAITLPYGFRDTPDAKPALVQSKPLEEVISGVKYSQNDLVNDQFFKPIRHYMLLRYGVDELRNYSREDIVEKYLDSMRSFAGGNLGKSAGEISFLNTLEKRTQDGDYEPEHLKSVAEAYAIYEGMEGIWSDTVSSGERLEAVGDFLRSTVLDPSNLISLGVGKAIASTGATKTLGVKAAQNMAMRAYQRELKKKSTKEVALKAADKVFAQALHRGAKQKGASLTIQRADAVAKKGLKKLATTRALKEIGGTTAVDMAVAAATDFMYQNAMIRTDNQEEVSTFQLGLAALGGLMMGGVAAGGVMLKGQGFKSLPHQIPNVTPEAKEEAGKELANTVKQLAEAMPWRWKVGIGKELNDLDDDFWTYLLLGDKDNGIKGFAQILAEKGYVWQKRHDEDIISNFLADAMRDMKPASKTSFIKNFKTATGIDMVDGRKLDMKEFSNAFARKMNRSAKLMNGASQAAKILGKNVDEITVGELAAKTVMPTVDLEELNRVQRFMGKIVPSSSSIVKGQSNLIRLLVSDPGTTALNIMGWGINTSLNTAVDLVLASGYGGTGMVFKALGRDMGSEMLRTSRHLFGTTKDRLRNFLDPDTTYEAFQSYMIKRPEQIRKLTHVIPGGVDDVNKMIRFGGFDPDKTALGQNADKVVDVIQHITGVTAQDVWTKSQEFIYQLDKGLRTKYNMRFDEFFQSKDASKLMLEQKFIDLEAHAVQETLRSIYSKSYKGRGLIGELAAVVEDFRQLPGVGLLLPFGKFFNNTLAFMADGSGISLVARTVGVGDKARPIADVAARAAIGWGAVLSMVDGESDYIDMGLNWDEGVRTDGSVRSFKYDFPLSAFKAAARLLAYKQRGESPPGEVVAQIREVNLGGQLFRQFDDFGQQGTNILDMLLEGDFFEAAGTVTGKVTSQIVASGTRWLDTVNQAAALAQGSDFAAVDRRQGKEYINRGLIYVEQILKLFGKDSPERFDAAQLGPRADMQKKVGIREVTSQTSLMKLANLIGVPYYKIGEFGEFAKADNRYAQIFLRVAEPRAKELLYRPGFIKLSSDKKKELIKKHVLDPSKKNVISYIRAGMKVDDPVMVKQLELADAYSMNELESGLNKLNEQQGTEWVIEDLTYEQLDILEAFLKFRLENEFMIDR